MNFATQKLHETLIRLCKGIVGAWEEWVRAETKQTGPTPEEHFAALKNAPRKQQ